jgi:ubiquinone/menaquinone biosynthesis C-methylase UbiE
MLSEAETLCEQQGFENVTLIRSDAARYFVPEAVDGVLFSLSYATMSHHKEVLRHAWKQLKPGGWLVIMDAKLPSGFLGKIARLCLPFFVITLRLTVLGNPFIVPVEELRAVASNVEVEEHSLGTYFVCRAKKLNED